MLSLLYPVSLQTSESRIPYWLLLGLGQSVSASSPLRPDDSAAGVSYARQGESCLPGHHS